MKVIIAGSRTLGTIEHLHDALEPTGLWTEDQLLITEVVSGGARGVDARGELFAEDLGIPCKRFPADWDKHGKGAGFIRNAEMAEYADALVAIWDGKSRGTKHMIDTAKRKGLKVWVLEVSDE